MSLRRTLLLLLSLCLGCASFEDDAQGDAVSDASDESPRTLELQGDVQMNIVPNGAREITVLYLGSDGTPLVDQIVEFGLTGVGPGASLSPSRVTTDQAGLARTLLRVGGSQVDLEVRAAAEGATPVFARIAVRPARTSPVSVRVDYRGARKLASYTVTAIEGLSCAQATGAGSTGAVVHSFPSREEAVSFELSAGMSSAVLAWGRDAAGAKLARGCHDVTPGLASSSRTELVVPLENTALRFEGALELELELNVVSATQQLEDSMLRAVDRLLMQRGSATFAEADYYLDTVADLLKSRGETAALAALESARKQGLAALLEPALSENAVGPRAWAEQLAAELRRRGAGFTFRARYDDPSRLTVLEPVSARSRDGLQLSRLGSQPEVALTTSFDEASAQLSVTTLRIALGLGQYGSQLLAAAQGPAQGQDDAPDAGAKFEPALTCGSAVGSFWQTRPELARVGDVSLVTAACQQVEAKLRVAVSGAFQALDVSAPYLELRGQVPVRDRTEDGWVDDLGPAALEGKWGTSATLGELRAASRATYAI